MEDIQKVIVVNKSNEKSGVCMEDIQKIKESYEKVKAALYITAPFISSLLSRARIVVNKSVERAGVTRDGVIVINPEFWSSLDWAGKAWILGHELFHLAFRDHKRQGERDKMIWNVCCDAVNNGLEKELVKCPLYLELMSVTLDKLYYIFHDEVEKAGLSYDDFLKISKEELYRILPKGGGKGGGDGKPRCPKCGSVNVVIKRLRIFGMIGRAHMKCNDCGYEWEMEVQIGSGRTEHSTPVEEIEGDINIGKSEGEVIQEGDPEIYKEGRECDGEEVEEKWKNHIASAYDLQKSIGTVPAGLKRIVDLLLKSKVDWRALLKQAFRIGFGRTVVESWKRPSRKVADDFPGLRRFTIPTVWCLIDCSGSISERELTQFISEVYSIAGNAKVSVVVWDTMVYDIIEAKSKAEVISKVADRLRGYGGTEILNALDRTYRMMRSRDIVIIFSDFEIHDWGTTAVNTLLSNIAAKSSVAILCSTHKEVEFPGWRFIRIESN